MNKEMKKRLQELLDERYEIALMTDKKKGNEDEARFLPNNPDYIYYQAILDTILTLGLDYQRRNGKHIIF